MDRCGGAVAGRDRVGDRIASLLAKTLSRGKRTKTGCGLGSARLAGESEQLRQEAALRLIEDGVVDELPLPGAPKAPSKAAQWIGILMLTLSVVLLYQRLGGWEDVTIARALSDVERAQPAEIIALIARIESRAEARPGNADYALLLGEYYLSGNDPAAASDYFDRLIAMGATAPEILGKAAQAEFLANDRQLSAQARARAEQALAINTAEPAALATLGMAAFEAAGFSRRNSVLGTSASAGGPWFSGAIRCWRR